jgi:opacity protein-like surface antigen
LGEWAGFTPYVGGGIGAANLRINDYAVPGLILYPAQVSSVSHWNLSWAVMAGVAYRISPKLVLDVGYRYLNMGDIVGAPEPLLYTGQTNFTDVTAQELRIGFRWMFD